MLNRSKTASLSIRFRFGPESFWEEVDGLAETRVLSATLHHHGLRLRHVAFSGLLPNVQHVLYSLSTLHLTVLRIHGATSHFNLGSGDHLEQIFIPDAILTGGIKLRKLQLRNCSVKWTPCIPHTTTRLKVYNISEATKPTHKQFMNALSQPTQLQALSIGNAFPSQPVEVEGLVTGRLHLGHLRKLCILDSVTAEVRTFSQYIMIPSSARVEVFCEHNSAMSTHEAIKDISDIFPNLGHSCLNSRPDLSLETLQVDVRATTLNNIVHHHVRYSLSMPSSDSTSIFKSEHLNLTFTWRYSTLIALWGDDNLSKFFDSGFPLDNVRTVELYTRGDDIIKPETLAYALGMLPELAHVETSEV